MSLTTHSHPPVRASLSFPSLLYVVAAIGLAKKSVWVFFHKIKDTFFIFTHIFINLDILSMSATSCYWLLVGGGQESC